MYSTSTPRIKARAFSWANITQKGDYAGSRISGLLLKTSTQVIPVLFFCLSSSSLGCLDNDAAERQSNLKDPRVEEIKGLTARSLSPEKFKDAFANVY